MISTDYQAAFEKLMTQAEKVELGSVEKMDLLEKAINLADLMNKEDLQKRARSDYIQAATFADYPEKAMVAYSVLLKKFDENREKQDWFSTMDLLWKYKWIVSDLTDFPNIPKEKIFAALEDMKKRYLKADLGMKSVYHYSFLIYHAIGDPENAEKYFQKWDEEDRTIMADCEACSLSSKIQFLIDNGNYEKAIEESQPILSGKKTCTTIPNRFYRRVLIPYFITNQIAKAKEYAGKINSKPTLNFLLSHAELLKLKGLTNDFGSAVDIFEQNIHLALESLGRFAPFQFYLGGQILFSKMIQSGQKEIILKLPPQLSIFNANNQYATQQVLDWINAEIEKIEKAFNSRNDNDYYSTLISKNKALLDIKFG